MCLRRDGSIGRKGCSGLKGVKGVTGVKSAGGGEIVPVAEKGHFCLALVARNSLPRC